MDIGGLFNPPTKHTRSKKHTSGLRGMGESENLEDLQDTKWLGNRVSGFGRHRAPQ